MDVTRQLWRVKKAVTYSLASQVISSLTNFGISIYFIKKMTVSEFGLYGVGFAIVLFCAAVGGAMLYTQMVISISSRKTSNVNITAKSVLVAAIIYSVLVGFIFIFLYFSFELLVGKTDLDSNYAAAVYFSTVTYFLKDYFCRFFFAIRKEREVTEINLSIFISAVVMLAVVHEFVPGIDAVQAMMVYGSLNLVGILVGAWKSGVLCVAVNTNVFISEIRAISRDGIWAGFSAMVAFVRSQSSVIIVASVIGTSGVAYLNSARIFVVPVVMLIPAISQFLMARLAFLATKKDGSAVYVGGALGLLVFALVLIYTFFIWNNLEVIIRYILTEQYGDITGLVLAWCGYAALLGLRNSFEIVVNVYKKFKYLAMINLVVSGVSLVLVYSFVTNYKELGALVGMIISELIMVVLISAMLLKILKNSNKRSKL